jgi:rod shape-determining protein MreD
MHIRYLRYFLFFITFICLLIAESALFRIIPNGAIIPALHLVLIYYLSIKYYSRFILILSFAAGVIIDIISQQHVGVSSLLLLTFTKLVSYNRHSLVLQNFTSIFFYFALSIFLFYSCKTILIFELFGEYPNMRDLLLHIMTTIMSYPLCYMILRKI